MTKWAGIFLLSLPVTANAVVALPEPTAVPELLMFLSAAGFWYGRRRFNRKAER
jgi:hypothetical protein